jgi:hypothetical protein
MDTNFLKCLGCGRIHVAITEVAAAAEVRRFNEYFARLPPDVQLSDYGGRTASIERYKTCHACGTASDEFLPAIGYENSGVTMQCVIAPGKNPCDQ